MIRKTLCLFLALLFLCQTITAQAPKGKDIFQKVDLMVPTGDKAKETDVTLQFTEDRLLINAKKGGSELRNFVYTDIKTAEYSYSKHPRWRAGAATAVFIGVFALPLFFMKGKKHWLTIRTEKDFAVLRLDKDNYKYILPTFETRTGIKVETIGEDK